VKHLVESMDGEVGVEPNEPSGSIFWLRLPAAGSMSP
jgi:signal transduction histidine kinase